MNKNDLRLQDRIKDVEVDHDFEYQLVEFVDSADETIFDAWDLDEIISAVRDLYEKNPKRQFYIKRVQTITVTESYIGIEELKRYLEKQ